MDAAAPSRFRALWRRWSDLTRPDVVTLLVPALVLVGHSVLHATGRMASNGELRYMLIVAPFWGLLTARGVAWLADRLNVRRPYLLVGALALAPALVNLHYRIVPVQLQRDERIAAAAARWWRSWPDRDRYPTVISPHPAVYYYMDRSPTSWSRDQITDPRPGVLLVFNDMYGSYNADSTRSITTDLILASGWTPVEAADPVLDIRPEPEPENKGLDWRFRAKWSNWRVYRSPTSAVE